MFTKMFTFFIKRSFCIGFTPFRVRTSPRGKEAEKGNKRRRGRTRAAWALFGQLKFGVDGLVVDIGNQTVFAGRRF